MSYQSWKEELCNDLRANDPDFRLLILDEDWLDDEPTHDDLARLSDALQSNTTITSLVVTLIPYMTTRSLQGICHFIATSAQLTSVTIKGDEDGGNPMRLMEILTAVSLNGHIEFLASLDHTALRSPQPLELCLRSLSTSLKSLTLQLSFRFIRSLSDARFFAECMDRGVRSNCNFLENLSISVDEDNFHCLNIFLNLLGTGDATINLRRLEVDSTSWAGLRRSVQGMESIQTATANMPHLKALQLRDIDSQESRDIIFTVIQNHPSLIDVDLPLSGNVSFITRLLTQTGRLERFASEESPARFRDVFRILKALVQHPHPNLTCLEFHVDMGPDLEESYETLGSLIAGLTGIHTLILRGPDSKDPSHAPRQFLRGLELNTCLKHVEFDWVEMGSSFHRSIVFYTGRNAFQSDLVRAPKSLWSDMFATLQDKYNKPHEGKYQETAKSIILECLRIRSDWYEDEDDGETKWPYLSGGNFTIIGLDT